MLELFIAFGAGLISFLSPCVLPLIPGYVSFICGTTLNELNNKSKIKERLSFPNKSTRKDKSREDFIKGGYSLPPVVLETPRPPVSIKDGKFSIGGL